MNLIVDRNNNKPIKPPAEGFKYVDQGNYATLPYGDKQGITYFYSDSATSCIITIAAGTLKSGTSGISLAHLDSPACIQKFFEVLVDSYSHLDYFCAQGANPPDNETSQKNEAALKECLQEYSSIISQTYLYLGEGDPREENRGDFGINFADIDNLLVTNQPFLLGLPDRDPTCGAQSVYCIMRRQEDPPVQLRNAMLPFTFQEIMELVKLASTFRKNPDDPTTAFTNIINLQNEEVRQTWSTTPEDEAPWFSDQLKQASCFTLNMLGNLALCEQYLLGD
jgi:hypothetical protein